MQVVFSGADGVDADGGADLDHDLDLDHDADLGPEAEVDHAAGGHGGGFLPILLNVRFWTFGAMAFGMVGSLLHFLHLAPSSVTPVIAVAMGLLSGWFASWVFRALARASTQSGAEPTEAVGQVGKVLVAVRPGARGKVRIQLRGQTVDFLASTEDVELEVGEQVLVTEVREDQVQVSRAPVDLFPPASDR